MDWTYRQPVDHVALKAATSLAMSSRKLASAQGRSWQLAATVTCPENQSWVGGEVSGRRRRRLQTRAEGP
jgi:hypothetical protein